jgi:ATP-binding cassette subfamily F protein 3
VTEILRPQKPVLDEFRRLCDPRLTEQELKDVLGLFMLGGEYWDRKVERLSGGEKARLVLASLFLARANFLVLDEPTNHLDLESREALVAALQDYQGTVFMVAHDRWVLSQAASEVWELSPGGDFDRYMGGWRQYEAARLSGGADANDGAAGPRGEGGSRTPARRKGKGRDTRRQAADIRNKASRDLAPLRKEYERLESDLATVIERIGELEAALADPSLYEAPNDMARVNAEYKQARENEERLFAALSDLEERIKALEAERDRKLAGAEA